MGKVHHFSPSVYEAIEAALFDAWNRYKIRAKLRKVDYRGKVVSVFRTVKITLMVDSRTIKYIVVMEKKDGIWKTDKIRNLYEEEKVMWEKIIYAIDYFFNHFTEGYFSTDEYTSAVANCFQIARLEGEIDLIEKARNYAMTKLGKLDIKLVWTNYIDNLSRIKKLVIFGFVIGVDVLIDPIVKQVQEVLTTHFRWYIKKAAEDWDKRVKYEYDNWIEDYITYSAHVYILSALANIDLTTVLNELFEICKANPSLKTEMKIIKKYLKDEYSPPINKEKKLLEI